MTTEGLSKLDCYNEKQDQNSTFLRECEKNNLDQLQEISQLQKSGYTVLEYQLPKCGPDGWYAPVKVENDKKICVDKYGNQIEKYEAKLNTPEANKMNCKCARTKNLLSTSNSANKPELPLCQKNGNFEPKQCTKNPNECWCVDEDGNQIQKEVSGTSTLQCKDLS
ncbi:thyroglobulin-like [Ctenocephalides felis]|uniref:thyroglobulin-like n=1 Tax=Ctenocephalides felis TaxID=7515 RepID=UPI000E6E3F52|nr:thyroglobulin-like [Ctenocephalides felis]